MNKFLDKLRPLLDSFHTNQMVVLPLALWGQHQSRFNSSHIAEEIGIKYEC